MRTLSVLAGSLVLLAACSANAGTTPPPDDGDDDGSGPPVLNVSDADVDGPAIQVGQALAAAADEPVRVAGALFVAADGSVLLCSGIAESFPPQCAGDRIEVVGLDLEAIELQTANDVSWAEAAEIVGTVGS